MGEQCVCKFSHSNRVAYLLINQSCSIWIFLVDCFLSQKFRRNRLKQYKELACWAGTPKSEKQIGKAKKKSRR